MPEMIVAKDQVAAFSDKAWLLFWDVVFRMMNGNEQTRKNIIAIPQERKENLVALFEIIPQIHTILRAIKKIFSEAQKMKIYNLLQKRLHPEFWNQKFKALTSG